MTSISKLPWFACLLVAAACSGGGDSPSENETFQFRATASTSIEIRIVRDGVPLQGASVSVVDVFEMPEDPTDSAALAQGTVYYQGGTDEFGVCSTVVEISTTVDTVDVIVQHDGSIGAYSEPGLRDFWGYAAPSARLTVPVAELGSLTITLKVGT